MATKQGKRTGKTQKPAAKKNKAVPVKKARTAKPKRHRERWSLVPLLLAIFSALGYFGVEGLVIKWLVLAEAGLVGFGYWILPPVLLLMSGILLFHGGRPVQLRCFCAGMLPVLFGTLIHTFCGGLKPDPLAFLQAGPKALTGGLLGGLLACGLVELVGKVGCTLLILLLVVVFGLVLLEVPVASLVSGWDQGRAKRAKARKERPKRKERAAKPEKTQKPAKPAQEEEWLIEEVPEEASKFSGIFRKKEIQDYDVPMEEDVMYTPPVSDMLSEDQMPTLEDDIIPAQQVPPKGKGKLFDTKIKVSTPGQYLEKWKKDETKESRPKEAAPAAPTTPKKESGKLEYSYPPVEKLREMGGVNSSDAVKELQKTENLLVSTIESFGIETNLVGRTRGPAVTRYEIKLPQGVKLAKITNLSDDIALSLGVVSVRIAPVPGKYSVVGVEVPNRLVTPVPIRSVIDSPEFKNSKSKVSFAVGKDIAGRCVVGDIATLPHLLIAGTTGSGKSVCTNSLIVSLLYKSSPEEVRLIMVDPKMVELGIYNGIPHLLIPVVTDPKKAAGALQWAVYEMMRRYEKMADWHVRDLDSFNHAVKEDQECGEEPMPQIVVIIDELADLMLVAAKEVEESICRLAQMGRAAGMHLIIATQRPSTDVITGLMKANIPSRIAFAVASSLESRIILDVSGAEKLVGKGDMLYAPLGKTKKRVQGCLISDKEVSDVVQYIKQHSTSNYNDEVLRLVEENARKNEKGNGKASAMNVTMPDGSSAPADDKDEHFYEAVDLVVEAGAASTSMLQRRLKLGYARAGRLMDQLEEYGYVGPSEGSKSRQVLISKEKWQEKKLQLQNGELDPAMERAKAMSSAYEADFPPFDLD